MFIIFNLLLIEAESPKISTIIPMLQCLLYQCQHCRDSKCSCWLDLPILILHSFGALELDRISKNSSKDEVIFNLEAEIEELGLAY